jgi:hypothetical protein
MSTITRRSTWPATAVSVLLSALSACTESSGGTTPPSAAIAVAPATATVSLGGTITFTSTVTGTTDLAVIWSVLESGCGSVAQDGVYTAPTIPPPGTCHVAATSHADGSKHAVAEVTVSATPVVSVSVSPTTATVPIGGTATFTATVSGSSDVTVTWSIQEVSGCGSVTQGGVYTAPATLPSGACHVVATSHADATKSAVAVVTVSGSVTTLGVRGRDLIDTCGDRLLIRGVDQIFGVADAAGNGPFSLGGSYTALVDQIALTGANAIRIQPQSDLPAADVDAIIGQAVQHNMVVYVSNNGLSTDPSHLYSTTWIANPDIRAVLLKPEYAARLIIDALPEPPYDDRARWRAEAISQIAYARGLGYTHPLALMGNFYGRDLPAILSEGAAILATDPLRRVQFIWEAYWGPYYETRYGMTLTAGLNAAAAAAFPIGVGLINWSEVSCTVLLDYQANMATAQANGLSWTWWDWVLPGYRCFDLSTNGYANSLTTAGQTVVNGTNGITATSRKACGP